MITDENSTKDELFQKHDVALRAFILDPKNDTRSALYASNVALDALKKELNGRELDAFSQRYWDQVVRVHSEMRTQVRQAGKG
jgi:hypothetical protein